LVKEHNVGLCFLTFFSGMKWFLFLCEREKLGEPMSVFREVVSKYFKVSPGGFNHEAREKAGFTREWYENTREVK